MVVIEVLKKRNMIFNRGQNVMLIGLVSLKINLHIDDDDEFDYESDPQDELLGNWMMLGR